MSRFRSVPAAAVALLAALSLLLSACSSSAAPAASTSSSNPTLAPATSAPAAPPAAASVAPAASASVAPAASPALAASAVPVASVAPAAAASGTNMVLNVGQTSDSVAFFPLFVAEQQGYFTAEGLRLGDRPRLGTGANLAAALTAGSIDVAGGVMTDALSLANADRSAEVIGALVNGYYVDVVVSNDFMQKAGLTDQSSLADKVKALKGKNVGITGPGSGTEALLIYLAKQQGMDAKQDMTLVNLGSDMTAVLTALKANRVDAVSFFQPVGQAAEAEGLGHILISPARGDVPELQGVVHGIVFTRQDVLTKKADAVKAFIRGIAKAEQLINSDPKTARTLLGQYQPTLDPKALDATLTAMQPEIPSTPTVSQDAYQKAAQFHQQAGLIAQPPAYNQIVAADVISQALAGQ